MILLKIFDFIAKLFSKSKNAEKPVSPEMQTALEVWVDMYQHQESSVNDSHSLDLPFAISSEFARLVMAEAELHINSEFLNTAFQTFLTQFLKKADLAFALGSMAFKPYVSGNQILIDIIRADRFAPTAFDSSGQVTSAVFLSRKVLGKYYYTRLETHSFDSEHHLYTVENKAYFSLSRDSLGIECDLHSVPDWANLQAVQSVKNIEKPLFAVYQNPASNTIDSDSPVGMSCFAHAENLIHEANDQWARIQWEFKGTELAVDASQDLFRRTPDGSRFEMPVGNKRLFRKYLLQGDKLSDSMQVFSPAIRDESLFNGLNHILQRIEFNVGLAYGTLSNPNDIEKTAEEIRSSKQRSYTQVRKMQNALQSAFENLVYAMSVYASLYQLDSAKNPELSCNWGDSVLEDPDKEFQQMAQLVTMGVLRPEILLEKTFKISEKEALKMIPEDSQVLPLFGEEHADPLAI